MLKFILTFIAVTTFGILQAQTFKFSAGYGFPWVSRQIGTNNTSSHTVTLDPNTGNQIPRTISTSESVNGSYASGWTVGAAFGYKLSEHIGLDLGLNYILGKEYIVSTTDTDIQLDVVKSSSRESETSQCKAVSFTPTLKFVTTPRIFTPYFLVGPVFSKINFSRESDHTLEKDGIKSSEYRYTKFSGGISIGLRGAIGAQIILNSKLSLFSEIIFTGMNYYPKKSEITRYIVNGEDKLNTLTGNVRKTIYVEKVVNDSSDADDLINTPGKSVRFPIGVSSLSANIGIIIDLH